MSFDLVNSRTFKDLWNEIQALSSTCPVFKYIQGLEFRRKKLKYFQVLSRMRENPVCSTATLLSHPSRISRHDEKCNKLIRQI